MSADLERYFDTMQRRHDINRAVHQACKLVASAVTDHDDVDYNDLHSKLTEVITKVIDNE